MQLVLLFLGMISGLVCHRRLAFDNRSTSAFKSVRRHRGDCMVSTIPEVATICSFRVQSSGEGTSVFMLWQDVLLAVGVVFASIES